MMIGLPLHADWQAAMDAYRRGDYRAAADEFTSEIKKNPSYSMSYYMLGMCHLALGELEPARLYMDEALSRDAKNPSFLIGMARIKSSSGKHGEAYDLLKSVDADKVGESEKTTYVMLMAQAALRQGKPEEAVEVLKARIAEQETVDLHRFLASAYQKLGQNEQVIDELVRVFELDNERTDEACNAINMAKSLAQKSATDGEKLAYYNRALAIAEKLIAAAPGSEHHLIGGEAALGAKKLDLAAEWFRAAYDARSDDPRIGYYLGRTLASLDQDTEAIKVLRAAVGHKPDPDLANLIHGQLGRLLACRLELDDAASHYRSAGNTERADEIAEIAASSSEVLSRLRKLRSDISEMKGMEEQLAALDDPDGVRAIRTKMAEASHEIAGIEENLAKVRRALCN
jgi:predicted Zn-dependent protease